MITFRWESPSYTTDILLCDESKKLDALQKVYIVANSQLLSLNFFVLFSLADIYSVLMLQTNKFNELF